MGWDFGMNREEIEKTIGAWNNFALNPNLYKEEFFKTKLKKESNNMDREEIVEAIAESLYQYSACIEEIVENTAELCEKLNEDIRGLVQLKVESRSTDPDKTRENFKELGWY